MNKGNEYMENSSDDNNSVKPSFNRGGKFSVPYNEEKEPIEDITDNQLYTKEDLEYTKSRYNNPTYVTEELSNNSDNEANYIGEPKYAGDYDYPNDNNYSSSLSDPNNTFDEEEVDWVAKKVQREEKTRSELASLSNHTSWPTHQSPIAYDMQETVPAMPSDSFINGYSSYNSNDYTQIAPVDMSMETMPAMPVEETGNKKKKKLPPEKDTFLENVITVAIAILIAMLVRTVWIEPFSIPSGSMIPTLEIGDYLFINKNSYGYSRYSLPFGIPIINGRIAYTEPERGDVIVFKLPSDNETDYIKRVIGMPGDLIRVQNGRLFINGKMVERKEINTGYTTVGNGQVKSVTEYIETLPNGKAHRIYEISDTEQFDNTKTFTVPYNHFFMMGDNRDNSLDSRSDEVGFVSFINLEGKATYLFFSKDSEFSWLNPFSWFGNIRMGRIGNRIE